MKNNELLKEIMSLKLKVFREVINKIPELFGEKVEETFKEVLKTVSEVADDCLRDVSRKEDVTIKKVEVD